MSFHRIGPVGLVGVAVGVAVVVEDVGAPNRLAIAL